MTKVKIFFFEMIKILLLSLILFLIILFKLAEVKGTGFVYVNF